ncbi:MAG TPA: BrxA family protein [Pirellulales bacterium]|nr:BrxA family protein [Pirellulales bacterium]
MATIRKPEKLRRELRPRSSSAPYCSKIIKAGALLADTKTLLAHWDVAASVKENMDRIRRENLFGKASRSRVEDVLAIFRQRILGETSVTKALVVLVRKRLAAAALDRILYFHAARSDRLLRDTVSEILIPLQARGISEIDTLEIQRPLKKWVAAGMTSGDWSEPTIRRIAQGLLSTLRDFGVLQGAAKKRIGPAYLPLAAFAYVAFHLKQHQPSGARLVELPDWKLFFLPREGVERFLFEAHQHNLLEYHVAGSVSRLTFPADTLQEYAHVIAQRAD